LASVELRGLTKRFGSLAVVDNVSLRIDHGQLVCLLGPSGCGKTTTLRLIAGFEEPDVRRILDATGLDARSLKLELTESVLMEETVGIAQTLQELRARGVCLALDDFGTGYSSLGHLRQFTVDILKLDRSFVSGIGSGVADGAILRAVIGLGNTLGLLTIGEGIERPEQLAALNAMGCHAGQGYHLSRPLKAEDLDALLATCLPSGRGLQLPPSWKQTAA